MPLIHEAIEKAREGGEGIFSGELLFCLTRVGFHCVFLEGNKNKLWKSVGGGMPSIYLVYGSDRRLHSYCVCLSATVGTNAGQRLNQLHLPPPCTSLRLTIKLRIRPMSALLHQWLCTMYVCARLHSFAASLHAFFLLLPIDSGGSIIDFCDPLTALTWHSDIVLLCCSSLSRQLSLFDPGTRCQYATRHNLSTFFLLWPSTNCNNVATFLNFCHTYRVICHSVGGQMYKEHYAALKMLSR